MKIKLSRDTVLGFEKHGKAGQTVEVEKKQGRELVLMNRGVEVPEMEVSKPAAKKDADKPADKPAAKKTAKES